MTFFAGFALGLAGSVHCVVMCGPLIAVVSPRGWSAVLYHGGRSITYVTLGAMAGLTGAGATAAGLGRWISWIAAVYLLALAVRPLAGLQARQPSRRLPTILNVAARARTLSRHHPQSGAFVLGALNGLLPCALTYAATIAAIGTGTVESGLLLMTGFATATASVLAVVGVIGQRVAGRVPSLVSRLAPMAFAAVALLLAWRGWSAVSAHLH